ncbi:MAG: hypothetical protein LC772_11105, partial [Chloroflexi bacterium]|nr:hypothetical protein [Chloroflexota bacterium]
MSNRDPGLRPGVSRLSSGAHGSARRLSICRMAVVCLCLAGGWGALSPYRVALPHDVRAAASFAPGDIFVSTDNGVRWLHPDGTIQGTIRQPMDTPRGLALNAAGELFVTDVSNLSHYHIVKFDGSGSYVGGFAPGSGPEAPYDIRFDKSGNIYAPIATYTSTPAPASKSILKFDAQGTPVGSFVLPDWGGGRFIDLAADQCTMYYLVSTHKFERYNVCRNLPESDFGTNLYTLDSASFGQPEGFRLLPDGGMMVADFQFIYRLDANGQVTKTYTVTPAQDTSCQGPAAARCPHSDWVWISLDPDGTSFWSSDQTQSDTPRNNIFKFDIATGNILSQLNSYPQSGSGRDVSFGLAVNGELTAAGPTTVGVNSPPAIVRPDSGTTPLTFTVSLNAPTAPTPTTPPAPPIPAQPVSVLYATQDGTARAGVDYVS